MPYLTIQLPLGVDLRPGAGGGNAPALYLPPKCTQAGHDASLKLDDKQMQALQAGKQPTVGFRHEGMTRRPCSTPHSWRFTKAFHGLQEGE